jgi:single-strand DNA-binding protein
MPNVNKHILIGHLGRDPELKYLASGTAVCNFSLATSRRWKDSSSGEQKERTDWHNIVAWGKTGEICNERLVKGSAVYIEGRVETRTYEKNGEKRYATETVAENVQFISGGSAKKTQHDPLPDDDSETPF